MQNTTTHTLTPIKKIIDLNGEYVNFKLSFSVEAPGPFNALVASQTTLDNSPNLEMKPVPDGFLSGEIVADDNSFDTYFLILTSPSPVDAQITVSLQPIHPKVGAPPPRMANAPPSSQSNMSAPPFVLIIGAFLVVAVILYVMMMGSKKGIADVSVKTTTAVSPVPSSGGSGGGSSLLKLLQEANVKK